MPSEEIPHTADWSLRVWEENLPALFAEAARGMNALTGLQLANGPRTHRTFEAANADLESLLVTFLSELVYDAEQEHQAYDQFDVTIQGNRLHTEMSGASILSMNKAIKAVTYHNLKIRQTMCGYEVEIVFDV